MVITSAPPRSAKASNFYPEPRYVVTPSPLELSWAFYSLRDIFSSVLDGASKIEFYGRLANTANRYLARVGADRCSADALVRAVIHEAFVILEEMEDGEFHYLDVAAGNTICDDLISESETSGYLGPDATRDFFKDMDAKLHDV